MVVVDLEAVDYGGSVDDGEHCFRNAIVMLEQFYRNALAVLQ